jgi:hypothetical protein
MKEQEVRGLHHTDATLRLCFWAPVYGNWIVSKHPETQNASFDYTRKRTLLAEDIGFATVLLAEHTFNPLMTTRFGEQIVPLLAQAGIWRHPCRQGGQQNRHQEGALCMKE